MNRPTTPNYLLLAGFLLVVSNLASADELPGKNSQWKDAVVTQLDVDFADTGFHARWEYYRCDCGDVLIWIEQGAPDGVLTGELLIIDGQVLLARGFGQSGFDLAPMMQAPTLMLQLTLALLNHSQPRGPAAVQEKQTWQVTEPDRDFSINTGLASGVFAAPWSINGSGWVTEAGHRRFELTYQFTNPLSGGAGGSDSMKMSGDLDYSKRVFPYPQVTLLGDWDIQRFSMGDDEPRVVERGLTLKSLREKIADM